MNVLDIKNPKFLKKMNIDELNALANDIRSFIIDSVSKTGGHLSSNLGVVELTIAMHYCFNAPTDKLLFDVGHQCYTHKILTGRAPLMSTLRQFKGISGFQKRVESEYDCFEAGHSSTALSVALGMATARDLNHENYNVIPLVGDGSLMSGLSLEALNQIGYQKRRMIIVFNDNNMSINKNVGKLTDSISRMRNSKNYNSAKHEVKKLLNKGKYGEGLIKGIHNFKEIIKKNVIDDSFFGEFGLYYIGPVDGHNIEELIRAFEVAKDRPEPVVIHCVTKKGKGYPYSENDSEGNWHGVGKFDIATGKSLSTIPEGYLSYSKLVANCLEKQMGVNKNIVCITPAMITGSSLNDVFEKYPDRCYDMGIAEDLAVDFACGLALNNMHPFVSIYSSFIQRAYDQLNHDVARMNLPVSFGIDRAGLVGADGETHHGVFDISLIRSLPNCVLAQGKDSNEIENLLYTSLNYKGPFFVRYPRGNVLNAKVNKYKQLPIGKWEFLINKKNPDCYILSYGNDLFSIENEIVSNNLNYSLINCRYLKPIDTGLLNKISNKPIILYTCDIKKGGLGDDILEFFNSNKLDVDLYIMGIDDQFVTHGSVEQLRQMLHLDLKSLFKLAKQVSNKKKN